MEFFKYMDRADIKLVSEIADRARGVACQIGRSDIDKMHFMMDISAVHSNGCRLRLAELLAASPVDFNHDVFGIYRHLDRDSGKLRDCFVPRYAV